MQRSTYRPHRSVMRTSFVFTLLTFLTVTGCGAPEETRDAIANGEDGRVVVTVPAGGQYPLDTNEEILTTVEEPPGALTRITLATPTESTTLDTPVLDGTLDPYKPYLPD